MTHAHQIQEQDAKEERWLRDSIKDRVRRLRYIIDNYDEDWLRHQFISGKLRC